MPTEGIFTSYANNERLITLLEGFLRPGNKQGKTIEKDSLDFVLVKYSIRCISMECSAKYNHHCAKQQSRMFQWPGGGTQFVLRIVNPLHHVRINPDAVNSDR